MASFMVFKRVSPLQFYSKFAQCNIYTLSSCRNVNVFPKNCDNVSKTLPLLCKRLCSSEPNTEQKNTSVMARLKQMYKEYWYVLVPVHLVTSVCWLGGFYYLAKSGVDVVALLKSIGLSDKFVDPLKDSSMGYYALTYGMYKVATPIRYTVTLGGTTISIKYLKNWGYIKPIPSREKMKEMYHETKQELRQRKVQFSERKGNVLKDIARYKEEMKNIKENELKSQK